MGIVVFDVELTPLGKIEPPIIPRKQRVNGLTITALPAGVSVGVQFGGNPATPPLPSDGPFEGLDSAPPGDTSEGVWLFNYASAPGSRVQGFASVVSWEGGAAPEGGTGPVQHSRGLVGPT